MPVIRGFAAFWYDFVVGDDWLLAVGVVVLLAVAGALAHAGLHAAAWVVMPLGVVVVLTVSLRRHLARRG